MAAITSYQAAAYVNHVDLQNWLLYEMTDFIITGGISGGASQQDIYDIFNGSFAPAGTKIKSLFETKTGNQFSVADILTSDNLLLAGNLLEEISREKLTDTFATNYSVARLAYEQLNCLNGTNVLGVAYRTYEVKVALQTSDTNTSIADVLNNRMNNLVEVNISDPVFADLITAINAYFTANVNKRLIAKSVFWDGTNYNASLTVKA